MNPIEQVVPGKKIFNKFPIGLYFKLSSVVLCVMFIFYKNPLKIKHHQSLTKNLKTMLRMRVIYLSVHLKTILVFIDLGIVFLLTNGPNTTLEEHLEKSLTH